MAGVLTMIGRISGTIHFVRKGDVSFSDLTSTSMTADAPKSSYSQTLTTETCHPRRYEWWAMTENLGLVHLKLRISLREQTTLIPRKFASSATRIARIFDLLSRQLARLKSSFQDKAYTNVKTLLNKIPVSIWLWADNILSFFSVEGQSNSTRAMWITSCHSWYIRRGTLSGQIVPVDRFFYSIM